jgi:Phage integrase family
MGSAPAFPTRTGNRRNKDNVRLRVIGPVVSRANEIRAAQDQPPIRAHVTPHTFRRTYITYMIAAGYDLPYVQAQVGHADPSVTLTVYAQVRRRADRDELRAEIRGLLGVAPHQTNGELRPSDRVHEKAGNGRELELGARWRAPHASQTARFPGESGVPPTGFEPVISCVKVARPAGRQSLHMQGF